MHHDTPLISTIVAGLVLAFIFGAIANRFRMPPLVGYLLAGILVGPYTPGFVADAELAFELSEIGVILLMFGVGLHFSLRDLLSVRAIAIPGAVVQIGGATLMGLGLGLVMGWGIGAGLLFGLALSVASTVVLLKALQERRLIETERGRIAVGWLIVEDLAMVLALVLVPALAGLAAIEGGVNVVDPFVSFFERLIGMPLGLPGVLALTLVKLAAFVGFMLVVGQRIIPFVLHATAHTGSRELFRLAVLAIALGVAAGASYLFGVSLALGAFFAGMILAESQLSHRAAEESLPLRDAFAVLFFVSVGMLFDPSILIRDPLPLLVTVFIIVFGKSILAFLIVIAFRRQVSTALVISASLAQIGEFSFILASLGVGLAILPVEARDLILGGAIISILLNPLVFWAVDRLRPRLETRFQPTGPVEPTLEPGVRVEPGMGQGTVSPAAPAADDDVVPSIRPTALSRHTVVVGYGRVGSVVAQGLAGAGRPVLVVEDAEPRIASARAAGLEVVVGNAASPDVLKLANVSGASAMLVAIPNAFEAGQATEQGRRLNANLRIIARAHSEDEQAHLQDLGADEVIMGEREIGLGMLGWLTGQRAPGATDPAGAAAASAPLPIDLEPAIGGPLLDQARVTDILPDPHLREAGLGREPLEGPLTDEPIAVPPSDEPRPIPPSPVALEPTPVEPLPEGPLYPVEEGPAEPTTQIPALGEMPDLPGSEEAAMPLEDADQRSGQIAEPFEREGEPAGEPGIEPDLGPVVPGQPADTPEPLEPQPSLEVAAVPEPGPVAEMPEDFVYPTVPAYEPPAPEPDFEPTPEPEIPLQPAPEPMPALPEELPPMAPEPGIVPGSVVPEAPADIPEPADAPEPETPLELPVDRPAEVPDVAPERREPEEPRVPPVRPEPKG
ncbi:hypothetical protein EMQ25_14240 [Arsenicitalea aurantiaca]|uniref:RCK N-terminal domain-containing protein n=1 Tax=Arsenicitalea aurantiaca TaxID=1783274 RepID=A0A433X5E8_9HYPH|nr:hypothetical protein EMQ25_14240 [Arsenicitalea aurantiaca]